MTLFMRRVSRCFINTILRQQRERENCRSEQTARTSNLRVRVRSVRHEPGAQNVKRHQKKNEEHDK